jgi:hypothetical protein
MNIIPNVKPDLNLPQLTVDNKLSTHLDEDPLLKYMNKRNITAFIGRPGSGKTSLLISFLQTPKKFKKVFHNIFVFMPSTSRDSLKNNIFNELPPEQLFEGITFENLKSVYDRLLKNKHNGLLSLIIFDDVQKDLKSKEVEVNLLHFIANSRHLFCTVWFALQSYNKCPNSIRKLFTDVFLFNLSKSEYKRIYDELIEIEPNEWTEVMNYYKIKKNSDPHCFIYFNNINKIFVNWDEINFE